MKYLSSRLSLTSLSILLLCFLACSVVFAANISSSVYAASCGGTDTSIVSCNEKDSNAIWSLLLIVINVMAGLVGAVAIGGFIYGAILYASAGNQPTQITKAKETLANVVLGLVLFALMWAFIQFLIPGGVFDRDYSAPKVDKTPVARTVDENDAASSEGKEDADDESSDQVCYTAAGNKKGSKIQGTMYHGSPYSFSNSPAGVRDAKSKNFTSIDLDTQITKDGVVVVTHWDKPMAMEGFVDPKGKIDKNRLVSDMTFDEVSRLKTPSGHKIYSLDYMAKILKENNLNVTLEIKNPKRFKKKVPEVAQILNKNNIAAIIKGSASWAGMNDSLKKARQFGFWTRGTEGSQGWKAPTRSGCKEVANHAKYSTVAITTPRRVL